MKRQGCPLNQEYCGRDCATCIDFPGNMILRVRTICTARCGWDSYCDIKIRRQSFFYATVKLTAMVLTRKCARCGGLMEVSNVMREVRLKSKVTS